MEPRLQTTTVNDVELAHLELGEGPLALCLHGFPDSAWTWRHLMPALADAGYRAVAPFLRGYAPSAVPADGRYQTAAVGLDACALHEALGGAGDAAIIGHDWGAMGTYVAASHEPERWRRVVAMAVPPAGAVAFQMSTAASLLGNPALLALALMLFLYVAAEVGVWNWLARHLIAQGVPESRALTILSLGFALGLLVGRVAVSPVLSTVSPENVLMGAAVFMAVTTYLMLQTSSPGVAWVAVFFAGVAMAPVFPPTLAVVNIKFPDMAATATGIAVTAGWFGLVVSSPIIGGIAGDDPKRLKRALLLLPAVSILMIAVSRAL